MNYNNFLEAVRGRPLKPQPEDPNAPTTPARQAIRDAGDVGKQELVGKVYPDMDTNDPGTYREYGKRLASAATGVQFGDQQDPIDRALDLTRPEAIYSDQQKLKRQATFKDLKAQLGNRPGGKGEGKTDKMRARQAEYDKKLAAAEAERDITGTEVDDQGRTPLDRMPTPERMQRTMDALKPIGRADATREVDDALDDAQLAAELPRMRDPLTITNTKTGEQIEIGDLAYKRHGFQPSNVDKPRLPDPAKKPKLSDYEGERFGKEMFDTHLAYYNDEIDEYLDDILSANFDKDKLAKGEKTTKGENIPRTRMDTAYFTDTSATGEKSKVRTPSERDLQTFSPEAEKMADFTPEVLDYQVKLRDAVSTQNPEKVQALAFTQDNITDEVLDRAIDRFGYKTNDKPLLTDRIDSFGISSTDRKYAAWGGEDLFPEGQVPDEFKPKVNVGTPKNPVWEIDYDAPHGVYDFNALANADSALSLKAYITRGRALLRTYLMQNGVDAYAPHEGRRAITDMDLEHIQSLKADAEDDGTDTSDSGFGYDHPNNWVLASGQLNKLRVTDPLTDKVDKYMQPGLPDASVVSSGLAKSSSTLNDFLDKAIDSNPNLATKKAKSDERTRLKREITSAVNGLNKDDLINLSPEERQEKIDILQRDFGFSRDQAEKTFPDLGLSDDNPVVYRQSTPSGKIGRLAGQQQRLGRRNYPSNPELYNQDLRTDERDEQLYLKGIDTIKKMNNLKTEGQALDSPEGQEFLLKLAMAKPAGDIDPVTGLRKPQEQPPEAPPEIDDDEIG